MMSILRRIAFAWSCLIIQLCEYQRMRCPVIYLPDDASDEEITELVTEQRELATADGDPHRIHYSTPKS